MKRILLSNIYCWPYFLYLSFSLMLIFSREPWIDEAWYTYPAVTLLREGVMLDVRWCSPERIHRFLLEPTSLVYALWYKVGGINIIWGRMLSVFAGLLFLVVVNRCLCMIKVPAKIRTLTIAISGINYFLLNATSQIRPEALALFATVMSLYMYLSWQQNTESVYKLILAHVFIIFAALLHLQATFVAIGLWLSMLLLNKKEIKFKHTFYIFSPYIFVLIFCLFYVYPLRNELIEQMRLVFGGDMLTHRGGMFAAVTRYLKTSQYLKFVVAIGGISVIGIGITTFWNKDKGRQAFFIYGLCGYLSWITTTTVLNDYHASWLILAFAMIIIASFEGLRSKVVKKKIFLCCLSILPLFLGFLGAFFSVDTIYKNPRVNVYENDLKSFDSEFYLRNSTMFGQREIMWYFNFESHNTFPLHGIGEYFIAEVHDAEDSKEICNNHFVLIKRGGRFALYRRVMGSTP